MTTLAIYLMHEWKRAVYLLRRQKMEAELVVSVSAVTRLRSSAKKRMIKNLFKEPYEIR